MAFHKRSIFLINPAFQLKLCFIVTAVIIASTFIYPIIIYDFFQIVAASSDQLAPGVEDARNNLIFYLIITQLIVSSLVFVAFIFITHKIAVPFYKLNEHLRKIREGGPISPLTFRKGDYFHDVAEEVSLFLETLQLNHDNTFQYLDEISAYIQNLSAVVPDDKKPILNEISRRLLEIKNGAKN